MEIDCWCGPCVATTAFHKEYVAMASFHKEYITAWYLYTARMPQPIPK